MSIYVNQPYQLVLETGTDLTDCPNIQIRYKKPISGNTGVFSGAISSSSRILHNVTGTENDEVGDWRYQTDAQYLPNGEYYPGETWVQTVKARFT